MADETVDVFTKVNDNQYVSTSGTVLTIYDTTCMIDNITYDIVDKTDNVLTIESDTLEGTITLSSSTNFFNPKNKHDNYGIKQDAIVYSLKQWLSVIKNELWYDYAYGIPLLDKNRTKGTIDAYIIKTVLSHPDINNIVGFESKLDKNEYSCYFILNSKYGIIEIGL